MSYGLKVWSSSSTLVLDTSKDRIKRLVGIFSFNIPKSYWDATTYYNIYIPGLTNDGTWSIIVNVYSDILPIYQIHDGYVAMADWWKYGNMIGQIVAFRN